MEEIWKDIKGYEGLYQVSNLGRVKSLIKCKLIRKPTTSNKGYYCLNLCKKGDLKTKSIHRLVAETFTENPNNYPCINHIDGNKKNNNVNNLEWCTYSHNNKEAFRLGLNRHTVNHIVTGNKKVRQFDLEGKFIKTWESLSQASRETKTNLSSICQCCQGKRKKAGGYKWEYKTL